MTMQEALLSAASELVQTLEAETAALRRLDLVTVSALTEKKASQATAYSDQARTFAATRGFDKLTPEMRERLKLIIGRVEVAAAHNATALSAAGTAHRRLLDTITRAVDRRSGRTTVGYGRNGRLTGGPKTVANGPSLLGAQVA